MLDLIYALVYCGAILVAAVVGTALGVWALRRKK